MNSKKQFSAGDKLRYHAAVYGVIKRYANRCLVENRYTHVRKFVPIKDLYYAGPETGDIVIASVKGRILKGIVLEAQEESCTCLFYDGELHEKNIRNDALLYANRTADIADMGDRKLISLDLTAVVGKGTRGAMEALLKEVNFNRRKK